MAPIQNLHTPFFILIKKKTSNYTKSARIKFIYMNNPLWKRNQQTIPGASLYRNFTFILKTD